MSAFFRGVVLIGFLSGGSMAWAESAPQGNDEAELHLFSTTLEREPFMSHARTTPRPRHALYEPDIAQLRAFLLEVQPDVIGWHQLYEEVRTSLRRSGTQLGADVLVGFAGGVGLRVGFGIEDRALVRRPHAFLQLLWSHGSGDDKTPTWSRGALGAFAMVTARRYQSAVAERTGATPSGDEEVRNAVALGVAWADEASAPPDASTAAVPVAMESHLRGVGVGIGHARVGAAPLLTIELPAFFWPLPNGPRGLVRRALYAEFDLIYYTQRLDYSRAHDALRDLRVATLELRRQIESRLPLPPAATPTLNSAHPLASVTQLLGESAVRRYQRGSFSRAMRWCAFRLGF